jgi:hypothetical protein
MKAIIFMMRERQKTILVRKNYLISTIGYSEEDGEEEIGIKRP